jgi:hypothetical protein
MRQDWRARPLRQVPARWQLWLAKLIDKRRRGGKVID